MRYGVGDSKVLFGVAGLDFTLDEARARSSLCGAFRVSFAGAGRVAGNARASVVSSLEQQALETGTTGRARARKQRARFF